MRVIICGAGQVGYGIAEKLATENNDVTVIDRSPHLVNAIRDTLDVRGFVGHGSHPDVLARAGADEADMLIAVTLYDEVNMVACQVAHSLFNLPTKIARIRSQTYLAKHWSNLFSRDHLPIDVIISPEVEVGEMVLRRLAQPGAVETIPFADDKVTVLGIVCDENCPVIDTPLRQLTELFPDLNAIVVGVFRNGNLFVPRSADQMMAGDLVYVMTDTGRVKRTLTIFGKQETLGSRVVIGGGGNIGHYVAHHLEKRNPRAKIKVIEMDRDRAVEIAEALDRTVVLHGSAMDDVILKEADIAEADTMLALTNDDKVNILSCVMAKKLGCRRAMSLLNDSAFPPLVRTIGIDAFVDPRAVTISRILQHVRRGRIRNVHTIQNGAAEVIEAEALETSPLVGRPLRELDLPGGIRIGAILHGGEVIVPTGASQIRKGDRLVIFAIANQVHRVEQMARVSLEYF
ncbi:MULTISPECIES: Trk system potassium transporter TrkA [Afifella]|uniref:Trk system potassium uptake protein TrkA n=2 Tax=Hyphomicrobiales TaxID=356 RepID=A0A1G5NHM3_AFIMA|nr:MULTISPECIES: Trk system potassium transporter TrkA [Afifella]MBK1623514.1 Trk system potassium transporter TrkA [Afifella marina DSM 2698]MBK1626507.1 Trk system potassium transporter TrkA [Afifella marina]MBK5916056.1 Trk system potassium transport protein TrkA [Afifella marina]MCF1502868.1 Trk system potassium transporter TrkA [Afifella sp. H1R]RAI18340.1 Trk system potassium transport protein TrkA [Afifella marina DSM 2698]